MTEQTVKLLLQIDICEGEESFGWAMVDVDEGMAAESLRRVAKACELAKEDPDLDYLVYAPEEMSVELLPNSDISELTLRNLPGSGGNFVREVVEPVAADRLHPTVPMSYLLVACEFGMSWRLGTAVTNVDTCYVPVPVLELLSKSSS